ncbi:hypothetical protein [Methylocystis heyeri]|uniref:Uncharacterized protein n=1 Tax=Methylocystis heyeri TaxID=391905 RepID=A0A6B8KID8_9HYPH|nr:hypothetical protein [Methylocystis heyeri]QGM47422.1 hypothetical protein H2LOC_017970 [Methylocystis heyeri]
MRRLFAIAMLAGATAVAFAAPRSIADCEKIEAALAYNECLASFGPAAGHSGGGAAHYSAAPGKAPPRTAGARRPANGVGFARATVKTAADGRVRMEFFPKR